MRFASSFALLAFVAAAACSGSDAAVTGGGGNGDDGGGSGGDDGSASSDSGKTKDGSSGGSDAASGGDACAFPCRDWAREPAIAVIPHATEIDAVSDVHGGYDRLVALLAQYGLISSAPTSPAAAQWAGGTRVLVVVGDLFDKGPKGLEVIELLMALEPRAAAAGGRVVTLLGNHEAEFFADPNNSKATGTDGVDVELAAMGVSPQSIANGSDPRGAWLLHRPVGALVGGWFFSHAGNTHGMSIAALESLYEGAIPKGFGDPALTGTDSILESNGWYTGNTPATNAAAMGAAHIVFGHDPNALGSKGTMGTASSGVLFRIDCGMSPDVNYSSGAILRVRVVGTNDVAEQLDAAGNVKTLSTSPTTL